MCGEAGRAVLLEHVRQTLTGLTQDQLLVIVAFDLDNFHELVVACGEATGQLVLVEAANRLVQRLATDCCAFWTNGDSYVVASTLPRTPFAIQAFREKIQTSLDEPLTVASATYYVSACTGVAFSHGERDDARLLVGAAEVACSEARREGGNRVVVFDWQSRLAIHEAFARGQMLREAITRREIALGYHPIVDLEHGGPTALGAEMTWRQPGQDLLSQHELLACAERHGLSVQLSEAVLEGFVEELSSLDIPHQNGSFTVAIPLAGEHLEASLLRSSENLLRVCDALNGRLAIEVIGGRLHDEVTANGVLGWLHTLGVHTAIEVGSNDCLLTSLRSGAIDVVTLDGSLVRRLHSNPRDREMITRLIGLAHEFGATVVADGVEDQGRLDTLRALGCDKAHLRDPSVLLPLEEAVRRWIA